MELIAQARGAGKTASLVRWLVGGADRIIVCSNVVRAERLYRDLPRYLLWLKLDPRLAETVQSWQILSVGEAMETPRTVVQNPKFAVDDIDDVLEVLLGGKVDLVTVTVRG